MRNDGRDFERYLQWFRDLDTQVRKGAITSSSGVSSHKVARTDWEEFFKKMEEKKNG